MGGNVASLIFLAKPKQMVKYATENLFSLGTIADRRGLPQKNVFEVLPGAGLAEVSLCNAKEATWFLSSPSYVSDIVSLCLLCRAIKPQTIFEIGTLTGYTTAHMALNAPDSCRVIG